MIFDSHTYKGTWTSFVAIDEGTAAYISRYVT